LKPEWWGLPFVREEKYQEKPAKREEAEIIIIIIIIIQFSSFIRVFANSREPMTGKHE
jgi:hypothetical protein